MDVVGQRCAHQFVMSYPPKPTVARAVRRHFDRDPVGTVGSANILHFTGPKLKIQAARGRCRAQYGAATKVSWVPLMLGGSPGSRYAPSPPLDEAQWVQLDPYVGQSGPRLDPWGPESTGAAMSLNPGSAVYTMLIADN